MSAIKIDNTKSQNIAEILTQMQDQLKNMETYNKRRFDELSTEIHLTSQQLDMTEESLIRRFGDILETLGAISHQGDGLTPANAGVELDAIIEITERAANRILDAAESISERLEGDKELSKSVAAEDINKDIQEILLACSFQDITGQRINNTLNNLKKVETRLDSTLKKLGIAIPKTKNQDHTTSLEKAGVATSQTDIDALFD